MSENCQLQQNDPTARRRYQFSLRTALVFITVLSLLFAIAARFPRHSTFTMLMTFLLLTPLVVATVIRVTLVRLGLIADYWPWHQTGSRPGKVSELPLRAIRCVGLCHTGDNPSFAGGAAIAVISLITLVGLWPVIREIGLQMALATLRPGRQTLESAVRSMAAAFSSSGYWLRLWQWELWSLGKWWLLFAGMFVLWLAVSSPFSHRLKSEPWTFTLSRFLAFAPWLIVLEVAFLIGVWIKSPNTVPEPSTGFVVGIFSWDLWRWDCWLDRGWLIRGAIPTFVVGYVFFGRIFRWPWLAAVVASVILIPIALTLSVACTVAYHHGFPWFV